MQIWTNKQKSSYTLWIEIECTLTLNFTKSVSKLKICSAKISFEYIYLHVYTSIPKVYTILLSRDLKNQKVGHHTPSKYKEISLKTDEKK